jgi:hypothetical protein
MSSEILKKYPEVAQDKILAQTFDFNYFLFNTGFNDIFRGYGAAKTVPYNYANLQKLMRALIAKFAAHGHDIDLMFNKFAEYILLLCFELHFVKYVMDQFREAFNNESASQLNEVRSSIVVILAMVDVNKFFDKAGNINENAITSLPNALFTFGEGLYVNVSEFNVDKFKLKVSDPIVKSFRPYFFYRHLRNKLTICPDNNQNCKRVYQLSLYIYMYFMIMSIFLIVFASDKSVDKYKKVTNENDITLEDKRQSLVHMMDSILLKMNDPTLMEKGKNRLISDYYDSIKKMSLENVDNSNRVVEIKRDIDNMQNNLKNFNAMENITARELLNTRISMAIHCIVWFIVAAYVFAATYSRSLMSADIVSLIAGAVLLYLLVAPNQYYKLQKVRM